MLCIVQPMDEAGDDSLMEQIGAGLFDDSPPAAAVSDLPESASLDELMDSGLTLDSSAADFSDDRDHHSSAGAGLQQPGDGAEDDDDDDDAAQGAESSRRGIKQIRIYAKTPEDLEVLQAMKGGLTLREAQDLRAAREAEQAEMDAHSHGNTPITAKEARLAELDRIIAGAGEEGSILTTEIAKAILEHSDLAADIRLARRDAETQQQALQAQQDELFHEEFTQVTSDVLSLYPAAQDTNSALSQAIDAEVQEIISAPNHPLRANPEVPMILAVKHARRLGIPPRTGHAPSAAGASSRHPYHSGSMTYATEAGWPRLGLTPASGTARTAPLVGRPTAAMIEADLQRNLATARNDEEAAGILATSLFGSPSQASPFA